MIFTSAKKQQISWVSWVWLKKWAIYALLKIKIVLAGNPFWVHLEAPYLVESWILMGTTTGKNLVSISLTILEKSKIEDFVSLFPHLVGKKNWYFTY